MLSDIITNEGRQNSQLINEFLGNWWRILHFFLSFFIFLFQSQAVSDAMLAEIKECFMEAYDDNKDGKIDIREVRIVTSSWLHWTLFSCWNPNHNVYHCYRCYYCWWEGGWLWWLLTWCDMKGYIEFFVFVRKGNFLILSQDIFSDSFVSFHFWTLFIFHFDDTFFCFPSNLDTFSHFILCFVFIFC